jgi:hypothetical protein
VSTRLFVQVHRDAHSLPALYSRTPLGGAALVCCLDHELAFIARLQRFCSTTFQDRSCVYALLCLEHLASVVHFERVGLGIARSSNNHARVYHLLIPIICIVIQHAA